MTVRHGKRLLLNTQASPEFMAALSMHVGLCEFRDTEMLHLVVMNRGVKYLVEDTPAEWRLYPIVKQFMNETRVNFTDYKRAPKPST